MPSNLAQRRADAIEARMSQLLKAKEHGSRTRRTTSEMEFRILADQKKAIAEINRLRNELRQLRRARQKPHETILEKSIALYGKIYTFSELLLKERMAMMKNWEKTNLSGKQMQQITEEMRTLKTFIEEIDADRTILIKTKQKKLRFDPKRNDAEYATDKIKKDTRKLRGKW